MNNANKYGYSHKEVIISEAPYIIHSDKIGKVVLVQRVTEKENPTGLSVTIYDFNGIYREIKSGKIPANCQVVNLDDCQGQEFIARAPGADTATSIMQDNDEFLIRLYALKSLEINHDENKKKIPDNINYNYNKIDPSFEKSFLNAKDIDPGFEKYMPDSKTIDPGFEITLSDNESEMNSVYCDR